MAHAMPAVGSPAPLWGVAQPGRTAASSHARVVAGPTHTNAGRRATKEATIGAVIGIQNTALASYASVVASSTHAKTDSKQVNNAVQQSRMWYVEPKGSTNAV